MPLANVCSSVDLHGSPRAFGGFFALGSRDRVFSSFQVGPCWVAPKTRAALVNDEDRQSEIEVGSVSTAVSDLLASSETKRVSEIVPETVS